MPCYDGRDTSERVSDAVDYARKEFRHNSDVAELLCTVLRKMEETYDWSIRANFPKAVGDWWEEHKERDRKKAESEKKEKAYQKALKEWEAKKYNVTEQTITRIVRGSQRSE